VLFLSDSRTYVGASKFIAQETPFWTQMNADFLD